MLEPKHSQPGSQVVNLRSLAIVFIFYTLMVFINFYNNIHTVTLTM